MEGYKVTRIKIDGITLDLDRPITSMTYYQTTRRLPIDKALERLVKDQHILTAREVKRMRAKEDALIKALSSLGSIFIPDLPKKLPKKDGLLQP